MKTTFVFSAGLLWLLLASSVNAQPPFGRGDRDRGGFGDRDGDRGGFRSRGGFPGRGGFGERDDDDDDDDRGRFRGRRGGGFPGRGGRSGRGGFDPSDMLRRLDRNDNGVLDPDEQEGPAGFLIRRLQRDNPNIEAGKPIPLDRITDSFEQMRRGRDDRDEDRGRSDEEALAPELLVPGFGVEQTPAPLLGFGPAAEMLSVPVTEQDQREAAERMRRYDRDRDGFLTPDELRRSRLSGNPLDFDRNRDGRLSASELASRYARQREAEQNQRDRRADDRRQWDDRDEPQEIADPYGGRNSYRALTAADSPAGLPGWFADKDRDRDGQVAMAEYSDQWNDGLVAEFFRFDLNRDGQITARECRQAVERGAAASSTALTASFGANAPQRGNSDRSESSPAASKSSTSEIADETIAWAEKMVQRYDDNGDGVLTAAEYEKMLVPPTGADTDQDGRVTVEEYAAARQSQ